jgi:hypothetical protein
VSIHAPPSGLRAGFDGYRQMPVPCPSDRIPRRLAELAYLNNKIRKNFSGARAVMEKWQAS